MYKRQELNKEEHTPETEEYGIGSFVYRSLKPFDPVRFWSYIQNDFSGTIIRSKGLFGLHRDLIKHWYGVRLGARYERIALEFGGAVCLMKRELSTWLL